jgi:hypothetical protein
MDSSAPDIIVWTIKSELSKCIFIHFVFVKKKFGSINKFAAVTDTEFVNQ